MLVPTEERIAVIQVPIFCPMIIGIAEPKVTLPVTDKACKTPTEAELDWIIAVKTAPAITPRTGFVKKMNNSANSFKTMLALNNRLTMVCYGVVAKSAKYVVTEAV